MLLGQLDITYNSIDGVDLCYTETFPQMAVLFSFLQNKYCDFFFLIKGCTF